VLLLPVFLVAVVALIIGAAATDSSASGWHHQDDDGEEMSFSVANIFFELNDTDGDLGIHALIDGDPWKWVKIEGPNERTLLWVSTWSKLRRHGLTELFFESAEPPFDELSPRRFFRRFPAGEYEIEGRTLEGDELESEVMVTHMMPAPPEFTITDASETSLDSDAECGDEDDLPVLSGDVTIEWEPVETSHEEIGTPKGSPAIGIVRYQVVTECEDDDENVYVFSVDVPPSDESMSVTVPEGFFGEDMECKVEVLAREASGNQTAVEGCPFEWEEDEDE